MRKKSSELPEQEAPGKVPSQTAKQALLFSLPADIGEAKLTEIDQCTGERFVKLRPNLARAIIALRGMAMPVDKVAYALGVSVHIVLAVENLRCETVEQMRADTAKAVQRSTMLLAHSLMDDVANNRLKPAEKSFALSVLFNASQLAQGEPTAITKHITDSVPAADEWEAWLSGLAQETASRIGSSGENNLALAAEGERQASPGQMSLASGTKPLVLDAVLLGESPDSALSTALPYQTAANPAPNPGAEGSDPGGGHAPDSPAQ